MYVDRFTETQLLAKERCIIITSGNPFDHSNMKTSASFVNFTSLIEAEILNLLEQPKHTELNLSISEKEALND